ncbi:MAG: hypothetical protein ACUVUE_07490 [Candidatus Bathycorpusculaceae bacterium]
MKAFISLVLVGSILLSACSVYMAAKKEGVTIEELSQCRTRSCVLSKGAVATKTEKTDQGEIIESYTVQAKKGSTARAVMHGVLDVATFGIWEVAGTPMEGAMGQKKYYSIKVTHDKDGNVKKVEMLQ